MTQEVACWLLEHRQVLIESLEELAYHEARVTNFYHGDLTKLTARQRQIVEQYIKNNDDSEVGSGCSFAVVEQRLHHDGRISVSNKGHRSVAGSNLHEVESQITNVALLEEGGIVFLVIELETRNWEAVSLVNKREIPPILRGKQTASVRGFGR